MNTVLTSPSVVTERKKQHFQNEGYFILERCVPGEYLARLREHGIDR